MGGRRVLVGNEASGQVREVTRPEGQVEVGPYTCATPLCLLEGVQFSTVSAGARHAVAVGRGGWGI